MSTSKPEVVVVTGASAGIGRATVRAFAKRGAYIGLVARSRDGLEGARKEVEAVPVNTNLPKAGNILPMTLG